MKHILKRLLFAAAVAFVAGAAVFTGYMIGEWLNGGPVTPAQVSCLVAGAAFCIGWDA